MKKVLFLLFSLCYGFVAFAQDVIVLKSGEEINAIVQEVGIDDVKYKKYDNPNGSIYTILKSDIFMLKYANGDKDIFKAKSPKTTEVVDVNQQTIIRSEYRKNMVGFDIGIGGYQGGGFASDFGFFYSHNFSKYVGWDVFRLSATLSQGKVGSIQGMSGIRVTVPVIYDANEITLASLTSFKLGYGYIPDIEMGGLCYDIFVGVELLSKGYAGFVFNHQGGSYDYEYGSIDLDGKFYGFRVGWYF